MKQLFITIVCACTALAVMAGASRPDFSRAKQVFKKGPVAATTSVGQSTTGQVSLQQFMREHNVTPNDNRIMRKAPRRNLTDDFGGLKVMTVEVHPVEFDEEGYGIVSDTAFGMGWSTYIINSVINYSYINGFYGSYSLPFIIEDDTPWIQSCLLRDDTVQGRIYSESGTRYRNDTIRWIACYMMDDEYYYLDDPQPGTVYDDGSVGFDVYYYVYSEEIINKYQVRASTGQIINLVSADTVAFISPVYSNIYLLEPNGYHECDYESVTQLIDLGDVDFHRVDWGSFIVRYDSVSGGSGSGGSGSGGSGLGESSVIVGGIPDNTQGVHPKPVPPRKAISVYQEDPWTWTGWWTQQGTGTIQAPVYLFQLNDSTACIYNLYNAGYMTNIMTWQPDGSMTFPPQVLFYSDYEDFFNCSVEGDSIIVGNTGNATNDSIMWESTWPFSLESQFPYTFDNNKIYLYDGYKILIGWAETPTINITEGFGNYLFTGVTEEEGAEVYLFLVEYDDDGNIIDYESVDNPYTVEVLDVDQNIHLAAIADGYEIGKNQSEMFLDDFTVPGVWMRGDVNRDRYLTIADVTALIQHVLADDFSLSSNFNPDAADVNLDGWWTIADVTLLIHRILTYHWPED